MFLLEVLCLHIKLTTKHALHTVAFQLGMLKGVDVSSSIPTNISLISPTFPFYFLSSNCKAEREQLFTVKRLHLFIVFGIIGFVKGFFC